MNRNSFALKIKKRTTFEWLTLWIVFLPLLWGLLFSLLNVPSVVKYTADVAWVVLLCGMLFNKYTRLKGSIIPLVLLVIGFLIYVFSVYLFRYQSPLYFLWGIRNNFRYYIFFFAVIFYFQESDIKQFFRLLDVLFWVNVVITLAQYFVFGYKQDYLGGIFGTQKGCNAYTIIFLLIVVCYSLLRLMAKQEAFALCFSKCAAALIIAAIAELKVFFVFFMLILVMASIFTRFSWRKVLMILISSFLVFFGVTILIEVFKWDGFLSFKKIWELATQENYSKVGTVNRLSAIPTLAKQILHNPIERIFGLGLGNCDTSTFDFLNTPFYQKYSYLRYTWFSCARLFLEIGYVGIVIYIAFFAMCFWLIGHRIKKGECDRLIGQFAMIISVVSVVLMFYNSSLHTEAGYMIYFVLALPFLATLGGNKSLG